MKTQTAAEQTASNRRIMPIPTAALAKGRLKNETQNIYPALPDYILADLIRSLLQPSGRPTRTPAAGSFRRPVRRMVAGTQDVRRIVRLGGRHGRHGAAEAKPVRTGGFGGIVFLPLRLGCGIRLTKRIAGNPGPPCGISRAISRIIVSENGNAPPRRSELNLNRYGVASPYHTIRNVCGFVSLS